MSNATTLHNHDTHADHGHDDASKTTLGFWIYLMSDCLIFSALFATFAVLSGATAGGPDGKELFELDYVLVETMALLISSVTFGFAMLAMHAGKRGAVLGWLLVTFLFGAVFVGMEINEFHHLIAEGNGPNRSAYLSAFFTLIGTHGLHVSSGLLWMAVMMHSISKYGLDAPNRRRMACLSLFWHFLDLVWICVFTFVYLMGAL